MSPVRLRKKTRSRMMVALTAILFLVLGMFVGSYLLAMTQVGEGRAKLTALEINGRYVKVSAEPQTSTSIQTVIEQDLIRYNPPYVTTISIGTKPIATTTVSVKLTYSTKYYTYLTTIRPQTEYDIDDPCGGFAGFSTTLNRIQEGFPVKYYVSDSGYLVADIMVYAYWRDSEQYVKKDSRLTTDTCHEKIPESRYMYLQMDVKKGYVPILVEVANSQEILNRMSTAASYYQKFAMETATVQGFDPNFPWKYYQSSAYYGYEGEIKNPAWYYNPDNATLKVEIVGVPLAWEAMPPNPTLETVVYRVYFAPPGGKILTLAKEYKVESTWIYKEGYGGRWAQSTVSTYTVLKEVSGSYALAPVTTTQTIYKLSGSVVTNTTTVATYTSIYVPAASDKATFTQPQETVTVIAPMVTTTYTLLVSNPEQAEKLSEAYHPPKPLYQAILEFLQSFWESFISFWSQLFKV
jgi:hypothetical protein